MTRKQNCTCKSCGYIYSTPQKLRQHYNSNKNLCLYQDLPNQNPTPLANPEIEFLDALRLFDPPEIAETISSPEAEREYLEALEILEPIPQFHQTNIISSGCELLDDHYQVEIGKETNYQQGLFDDKIEEDNGEIDYKEVPFKNKAVVVTAKEDIPRIVDELIWDIENRIKTYIVEGSGWYYLESEEVNIEMPIFVPLTATSHLPLSKEIPKRNNGIINIKNKDNRCFERWIQFSVKADNDTIEKFEKQNLSISVSIYEWSEKELIPIRIASKSKVHNRCNHKEGNCQPCKLIRLLLISEDDPETGEPSQHYCLIQGREGLGKLARYTPKHNSRLYVCDYCISHRTHDPKIDAQHMKDSAPFTCISDAETLSTLIEKNQESKMTAIQEHKVISFDYIIRRSDGKTKAPVKIRGDDPAGEFIKAMEKEVEQCQDFLAGGHIIQNSAK
ncbi:DNA polymerase [Gigaspora margarita]|uniref:DNA polymerase n=1 Tax=Gigaspora margarita TaxID=4874 RepID=A0A8H4A5R0_GIGMA|nr:DNA polymerase [Gigaspora margarita]